MEGGLSATEALHQAQELGIGIRESTWYDLWSEVEGGLVGGARIEGLDPNLIPNLEDFSAWSAGREGTYAYQIDVMVRDIASGDISTRAVTVMSDSRISLAEAMGMAEDQLSDDLSDYGLAVLGSAMGNIYAMGS